MTLPDWLGPDGLIARHLAGFEVRPEQTAMAEAIGGAFAAGHHAAVEAGTGVGKTFAYLLPAIERIVQHHQRVVVSTHTIALQEQLIQKDVPLLRAALGVEFSAELVKGRNNYLSLRRLKEASQKQKQLFANLYVRKALHEIEDWAYETADGSLSDLPQAPPFEVWEKVRSEHNNCLGRRCPTYEECFYQRARRRAEAADLLVVNHALLVADMLLRAAHANVLPPYELLIVDEAHTLEAVASDQIGMSVSSPQLQHLLSGLFNERTGKGFLAAVGTEPQREQVVRAQSACSEFFAELYDWQRTQGRSNGRLVTEPRVRNALTPALQELVQRLEPLRRDLPRDEDKYELSAALERAQDFALTVENLLTRAHDEHVYWIDAEGGKAKIALCAAPLDVAPLLRQLLFDPVHSAVLTSATLADAGAEPFAYLLGRLGLAAPAARGPARRSAPARVAQAAGASPPAGDEGPVAEAPPRRPVLTRRLGSPFDYERQVLLHIEAGLPDPSSGEFAAAAARAVAYYLRRTEGRAFVLFTSYKMLNDVARLVGDELAVEGYTLLVQGESLPRSMMLARFRETERAAIFGTDSFWQGVDVVGQALSNVIIVKLPFVVPDRPAVEARSELVQQRGGNAFTDYHLPEAVLKFRQGFGRLIRSRSDRGIVVVLDPRILRKPYGRRFLDSIPRCRMEISERPW